MADQVNDHTKTKQLVCEFEGEKMIFFLFGWWRRVWGGGGGVATEILPTDTSSYVEI